VLLTSSALYHRFWLLLADFDSHVAREWFECVKLTTSSGNAERGIMPRCFSSIVPENRIVARGITSHSSFSRVSIAPSQDMPTSASIRFLLVLLFLVSAIEKSQC
jgi:hypothetical protein